MKKIMLITVLIYCCLSIPAMSQGINLIFTAEDSVTTEPVTLDSVLVYNITSDCDTVVYGPNPTLSLFPIGIHESHRQSYDLIDLVAPYPNPSNGSAQFEIILGIAGPAELCLYNLAGTALFKQQYVLQKGQHKFKVESSENTVLFIRVSTGSYSKTAKLINMNSNRSNNVITYYGHKQIATKSENYSDSFIFNPGDLLSYTIVQNTYFSELNYDSPFDDTTYTFLMNPLIDGWYIVGASTAYHELNENAMMKVTRNEVTQQIDSNLYELFIPVNAGPPGLGDFNLINVNGSEITTYGPDSDFLTVTSGLPYEPQVDFQRGSFTEGLNTFTVLEENRMYHIAIYTLTQKVVVVPVHWGMLGTATYNLWNSSIAMEESPFDLFAMSWSLDSIDLMNGEWKYRYSDGWKVFLDTTANQGAGVGVNANLGGSIDSLIPGGINFINNNPGIYTSKLEYVLGDGYDASLIFLDTLPQTNWNGVVSDAVGTGISPDNPGAIPDPSSWSWGYRLIADNGGVPGGTGTIYTWTWTGIILEAYEGFKLRTLDGLPSPINNMYFEAGYLDLNVLASTPLIISGGAPNYNLVATLKSSYTIVLHIDAANNNEREIIITLD